MVLDGRAWDKEWHGSKPSYHLLKTSTVVKGGEGMLSEHSLRSNLTSFPIQINT